VNFERRRSRHRWRGDFFRAIRRCRRRTFS
jgi:hypothetical protein